MVSEELEDCQNTANGQEELFITPLTLVSRIWKITKQMEYFVVLQNSCSQKFRLNAWMYRVYCTILIK